MLRKSGGPWAQVVGGGWPWRVTRGVPDPVLLDVCRSLIHRGGQLTKACAHRDIHPAFLGPPEVT